MIYLFLIHSEELPTIKNKSYVYIDELNSQDYQTIYKLKKRCKIERIEYIEYSCGLIEKVMTF